MTSQWVTLLVSGLLALGFVLSFLSARLIQRTTRSMIGQPTVISLTAEIVGLRCEIVSLHTQVEALLDRVEALLAQIVTLKAEIQRLNVLGGALNLGIGQAPDPFAAQELPHEA